MTHSPRQCDYVSGEASVGKKPNTRLSISLEAAAEEIDKELCLCVAPRVYSSPAPVGPLISFRADTLGSLMRWSW